MEVAAQASAFVLHRRDELLADALQLVREPGRTGCCRGLPDDVGEEPLVGRPQSGRGARLREEQAAHGLAAVRDGERPDAVGAAPVLDDEQLAGPLLDLDPDVGQPERGAEGRGHLKQLFVRRGRVLQPTREGGDHGIRVIPLAPRPNDGRRARTGAAQAGRRASTTMTATTSDSRLSRVASRNQDAAPRTSRSTTTDPATRVP